MRYVENIALLISNFNDRVSVHDGKQFKNEQYAGLANEFGNYFYTYESGDIVQGDSLTSCSNQVQEVTLVLQTDCFDSEIQLATWLKQQLNKSEDVQSVLAIYTDKYRIQSEELGRVYESEFKFAKVRFAWIYTDCYECTDFIPPQPQQPCDPFILKFQDNEFEVINEPCGKSFDLTCETLVNAVVMTSTNQSDFDGVYTPDGVLNGRSVYVNKSDSNWTIRYEFEPSFGGFLWIAENSLSGDILYSDFPNDALFPWGFLWQEVDLSRQATVSDVCCNGSIGGFADWELRDTDGNLLDSGQIAAGDLGVIVAPDATVENSDQSFQDSILSGGVEVLADYEFEFQDENGNVLNTEFRPAMIGETFIVGAGGACPTTFTYDVYVNGVFQQTVTIDVTQDINITT
jgi:hypothetical protein